MRAGATGSSPRWTSRGDHAFVLLPSGQGLSTAEVFARSRPNEIFAAVRGDLVRAIHTTRTPADVGRLLVNDLEPTVLELRPELGDSLERVRAAGAFGVAVSGSGPTVFGVFADRSAADRAALEIPGAIAASPL